VIDDLLAIDAHCHLGEMPDGHAGIRQSLPDDLIARMDRNGIDKTMVCHLILPLRERQAFARGNDLIVDAVRKHPDRLAGLCVINPQHGPHAQQEARRYLASGMRGIKLHPILHGFYSISGPLVNPIMEIAEEARVPVVTHSDFHVTCCTPYEVARLAARFPRVTVVMLHMGIDPAGLAQIPDIVAPVANLVVDTSLTPDLPYGVYVHSVRTLGADRVLFGSDGPMVSLEANLAKLMAAEQTYGLTRDEKRQILGANAARVFGIDDGPSRGRHS
jgi:predicted TIM-barrel fold metal-dependent hydrolase